jgi:septum site-determining protein MinD
MSQAIVVTSGKGGVGKTAVSVNIGAALAKAGKKICIIDSDIGLRNVDVQMGLDNRILYDIVDIVDGKCSLQQALVKDRRFASFYLLPASQLKDRSALTTAKMKAIVSKLKEQFDYVIIDCPPGIEQGFRLAISSADEAIVVTTTDSFAVRDADRVIGLLDKAGLPFSLIINRYDAKMVQKGYVPNNEDICSLLGVYSSLGVVPEDRFVIRASNEGAPIVLNPKSKASKAYHQIAGQLLGEKGSAGTTRKPPLITRFRTLIGQ